MGTNYYMTIDACPCCGRGSEDLHIGKSSAGWCFSLNTHPDNGIESLDDWRAVWAANPIKDEYGQTVSPEAMEEIITERAWKRSAEGLTAKFLSDNQAERGPRGLLRHRVDGRHCIAQGEGTYDLMRGEFS